MLQLMTLGWVPESDEQKATYLIGVEDWQSLFELGEPAVEPLIKALCTDSETSVCSSAAEALGEIGDARAVKPLIGVPRHPLAISEPAKEALVKLAHKDLERENREIAEEMVKEDWYWE